MIADTIFSATSKVQNYHIKPDKNPYTKTKKVITIYFKEFERYEKVQLSLSIIAVCHNSFSADIRSNQFIVNLII